MLGRTAAFLFGLIVIFLGVPFVGALLDVEESGAVRVIQIALIVLWVVGFIGYIAINYRRRYRPGSEQ